MQPKQIITLLALASAAAAAPQPVVVTAAPSINCTMLQPSALTASSALEAIRAGTDGPTHEQLGYIIQSFWDGYGSMMWACQQVQELANANATQA